MLQRAAKVTGGKDAINDFKRGADLSPTLDKPEVKIRKITHHIKLENWARLKKLSTELSTKTDERVTINMLLDMAIEAFFDGMDIKKEEKR